MPETNNTVFISYRRGVSSGHARAIFENLMNHGYDVFMDVESIPSGRFAPHIFSQIASRAHFIVILAAGVLERCINEDGSANSQDWLRREIEHAIALDRNVVPILIEGFRFSDAKQFLTGELNRLTEYNGLTIYHEYWDAAMSSLRNRYLKRPVRGEVIPVSAAELKLAEAQIQLVINRPAPTQEQLEAEQYYSSAFSKLEAGNLDGAIADYTKAIHLAPLFAAAYGHRGIARKRLGDIEGAITDYTRAIEFSAQYPYYAEYYYHNRGIAYHERAEYDKAISDYSMAIRLDPRFGEALSRRATAHHRKGESTQAIVDYTEAIRVDPENPMPYVNRAAVWIEQRDFARAIKDCTEAIRLDPKLAEAYSIRGNAYAEKGDFSLGIEDHNEALRINPALAGSYFGRAAARSKMGDLSGAITDYTEVVRLEPENAPAYVNRGWLKYELGDFEDAIADYTHAIELNPEMAAAYNNRGIARFERMEAEKAVEDYSRAIALKHRPPHWPLSNRGDVRLWLGDLDGAIDDCSEAIELDPTYGNAYRIRGEAHEKKGDLEAALSDYLAYLDLGGARMHNEEAEVQRRLADLKSRARRF